MRNFQEVIINLVIDGGDRFGRRVWFYVPHVGDEIMLDHQHGGNVFRIDRVVWGTAIDDQQQSAPTVDLHISRQETNP